jgi:hypothetical protein
MATREVSIRFSAAQVPTDQTPVAPQKLCSYCERPITNRVLASRKPYCGKLCAAMGLIVEVYDEDGIDHGFASMEALIDSVFYEGPRSIPVKVRNCDAHKFEGIGPARAGWHEVIVVIDDDGTPDWIPDPVLDADQEEIDESVDKLLRSQVRLSQDEEHYKGWRVRGELRQRLGDKEQL